MAKLLLDSLTLRSIKLKSLTLNETLFCPGMPGAGKSVLTSISVEHIKTLALEIKVLAVVYVFCDHVDVEHQRSIDVVASIPEQLLQTTG